MSHHSSNRPLTDVLALLKNVGGERTIHEMLTDKLNRSTAAVDQLADTLGPTGDHPNGRIVPHDEGGLMFGVTVFNGRVIFDFGTPVRSIGFTREGALELAELIRQRAEQCPAILFPKK